MENIDIRIVELIDNCSEINVMCEKALEKISQLKNFKDSGSVGAGEMEKLDTVKENLQSLEQDPHRDFFLNGDRNEVKLWLKNHVDEIERWTDNSVRWKNKLVALNLKFHEYENRFPELNVPKCHSKPLEHYLERLRGFMELTWKEPAKENREKKQSLIDWMRKNHQSKEEPNKTIFDALKTVLIDHGTRVSFFLIEHYMLVRYVISKTEGIEETLRKAESIIRCLSVEENSVVINAFISVLELFKESKGMAAVLDTLEEKDKKEEESNKTIDDGLGNERENGLLHLITIEVLRLEVCFCNPGMTHEEVPLATAKYLKDNVLKDKLNRLTSKVKELMKEMLLIRDEGWGVLELQVKDVWNKLELS